MRLDANPRITLPWRWGDYVNGYGEVGSQAAFYDTANESLKIFPVGSTPPVGKPTCPSRGGVPLIFNNCVALNPDSTPGTSGRLIPYAKAGISTVLDRVYDFKWKTIEKLKNTIEPFATYYYVPNIYQGNMPLFDSFDRLNSRSLVGYGVTTRLFAKTKETPEEDTNTDATLTEGEGSPDSDSAVGPLHEEPIADTLVPNGGNIVRNGEHSQEIGSLTVQQAYDIGHTVANGSDMSDVEALLHIFASRVATFSSQVDFSPRSHAGVTLADATLAYQPPWAMQGSNLYMGKALQGSFFSLGFNYANRRDTVIPGTNKNAAEFISGQMYTQVFDRMGVYFSPSYNIAQNQILNMEYGVRLKSPCDCWAADLGINDSFNPNEVQLQFQLTLGGLGSFGRSPFGTNPFQRQGLVGSPTGVLPSY